MSNIQQLFVITYSHRHGVDVNVFATEAAAREARAEIVMNNMDEIEDEATKHAIADAYEADKYDECYDLYKTVVDDESIAIDDCSLRGADVRRVFVVVDTATEVAHRVLAWPFAEAHGFMLCGQRFCWHTGDVCIGTCPAYLPKEPRTVTCLQCVAADAKT